MDVLTPLQRKVIQHIGRSPLADDFFLTGGTALAACYLQHRYSVDLDFFTANPAGVVQVPAGHARDSRGELRAFFQSRAKELMDRLEGGEEGE